MSLADITSRDAILSAVREFDVLGRDAFLQKYGFGPAQRYFLEIDGKLYDSKAIVGVARGCEHPEKGPMMATDFSGGENTVRRKLENLNFRVKVVNANVLPTGYWTFFCNPAKWEIDEFLSLNIENSSYLITDWQSEWFKPGQLGVVRVGGDHRTQEQLGKKARLKPGIYAIVEVLGGAQKRFMPGGRNWIKYTGKRERQGVDIKYLKNLLKRPLLLEDLENIPGITDPYLIKGFQSATMPLDPETFGQIVELAGGEEEVLQNVEAAAADSAEDIQDLEEKFSGAVPQVKEAISKRIERGPAAEKMKKAVGFKCMMCEALGKNPHAFVKRDGTPYVEAHHVIGVSALQQGALAPSNLLVVCANHHRQLHYGDAELMENTAKEFVYRIDGKTVRVGKPASDLQDL